MGRLKIVLVFVGGFHAVLAGQSLIQGHYETGALLGIAALVILGILFLIRNR